jgi:hypothetical protein
LLGTPHGGLEVLFGELETRRWRYGTGIFGQLDRRAQAAEQFFEARLGLAPGAGKARLGIDDEGQLAREVVDDGDFLGEQEQDVRYAKRIGLLRIGELRFDVAHRVVAEIADQSAREARQAGNVRHLEARHEFREVGHRVGVLAAFGDAVAGEQQNRRAGHGDARRRGEPDERVAAEALAALHRFEQIRVRAIGELEIDRQRGVEIGEGLEGDGDAVVALLGQTVEIGFVHGDRRRAASMRLSTIASAESPRTSCPSL